MATIIVNPTAASNGAGSLVDPKNTYAGLTWSAGDTILQVAGTTYGGKVSITTGGSSEATRVTFGVCEAQTGVQIRDGSQRAAINGAGYDRCIAVGFGTNYVTIDGFELYGPDTGTRRCLSFGSTSAAVSNHIHVRNCYIHDPVGPGNADANGISGFGSDAIIERNIIANIPTDGIWLQGLRPLIQFNRISMCALDDRAAGDCIQVYGDATLGSYGGRILRNFCDHSNVGVKQAIIYEDANGGAGGVVADNECLMAPYDGSNATNAIYMRIVSGVVAGNRVVGGLYGIWMQSGTMRAYGNLVLDAQYGMVQQAAAAGARIYNNTVAGCEQFGIYADTDTTLNVRNNVVMNCPVGIAHEFGATENYNVVYNCAQSKSTLGGGAISLGANSSTDDPLLDAGYRPLVGSPCIGAGVYIPGARHMGGKRLSSPADIGAYKSRYWNPSI